jgi:hypothetical protein
MSRTPKDDPVERAKADSKAVSNATPSPESLDEQLHDRIFEVWRGAEAGLSGSVASRVEATLAAGDSAGATSLANAANPSAPASAQLAPPTNRSGRRAARSGPGARTRAWALALALPAVAALGILLGRQLRADAGETRAAVRETVTLAGRGKAVLEAGAHVRWVVSASNAAVIHQSAGEVFYRVEKGGPFSVQTPAGEVRAVGTCFRVEVRMNGKRQSLLAGASGAALAAAVVVSVYEGKVLLAGGKTSETLVAGERAVMEAGGIQRGDALRAPRLVVRAADEGANGGVMPPPAELPAKYRAQSEELAQLRAQLAAFQKGPVAAGPGGEGGRPPSHGADNFIDPSREELLARAQSCTLAWDSPPLEVDFEPAKMEKRWGLTPDEAAIVTPILNKFREDQLRAIRDLYVEVTGAKALAEQLSPRALTSEIKEKAVPGEVQRAYRQISGELAGTIAPPGPQHRPSPSERLMRLQSTAGERFERAIAGELGAARAREIRKKNNGWNSRANESMGCPRGSETE